MFRRNRRLVCFDMDSTLIQTKLLMNWLISQCGEQVRAITSGDEWRN
jgi:phosphoserine phosphatase